MVNKILLGITILLQLVIIGMQISNIVLRKKYGGRNKFNAKRAIAFVLSTVVVFGVIDFILLRLYTAAAWIT